eukprot:TRINITY_DN31328_c0_g1_i1.p1 TRINITY_DN31328_c0_g1~~TRINITY_DN31328_c0_g1_i1.p1  ORF type:complete len:195 (+),score=38.48 TRINITY_DN31328_c0_g1_i1:39-623(+)
MLCEEKGRKMTSCRVQLPPSWSPGTAIKLQCAGVWLVGTPAAECGPGDHTSVYMAPEDRRRCVAGAEPAEGAHVAFRGGLDSIPARPQYHDKWVRVRPPAPLGVELLRAKLAELQSVYAPLAGELAALRSEVARLSSRREVPPPPPLRPPGARAASSTACWQPPSYSTDPRESVRHLCSPDMAHVEAPAAVGTY